MRRRQSCQSVIIETILRTLSTSAIIVVSIALVAVVRGLSQGIPYPLVGDDWYLVAGFLSIWCASPAVLTVVFHAIYPRMARFKTYCVIAIIQILILYGYCYYVTMLPDNEFASSPILLLVFAALPIALIYYPLYFAGHSNGKVRCAFSTVGICLIGYAYIA
ncbi:hypothetical protein L4C36_10325 [Photobacterium japonica]|uniref:hypothetical protein n=1 Tax=Photobacterium japonica TaxID=2910235 RepID=UPI003D127239